MDNIPAATVVLENEYNELANQALRNTITKYEKLLQDALAKYEEKLEREWKKHENVMKKMEEEALQNLCAKPMIYKEITQEQNTLAEDQLINVGGHFFSTSLSAMRCFPKSRFFEAFEDHHKVLNGVISFNRDSRYFSHILKYLKQNVDGNCFIIPDDHEIRMYLKRECEFYKLYELKEDICQNRHYTRTFPPGDVAKTALQKRIYTKKGWIDIN